MTDWIRIFKKGFNYSQDGPGNRLVYHLQGCNMRCRWCCNPEGIPFGGQVLRHLGVEKLSSTDVSIDEIEREIVKCRRFYFDGGGVTLTGGECTCQIEAVKRVLSFCREQGIDTAIETNATTDSLREILPLVDHLIMDCKHYDSRIHEEYTGIPNAIILDNIRYCIEHHPDVLIRTVLIDGVNASESDIEGFLAIYRGLDTKNTRFEFLPYHDYGRAKWEQCSIPYPMTGGHVTNKTVRAFEEAYTNNGLKTVRT